MKEYYTLNESQEAEEEKLRDIKIQAESSNMAASQCMDSKRIRWTD